MSCCSSNIIIVVKVHLSVFMVLFSAIKHSTSIELFNVLHLCRISCMDRKELAVIEKKESYVSHQASSKESAFCHLDKKKECW